MAAVGRGEMKASDVARAMYPDYKEERVARYGAKKSLAVKLKLKSPAAAEPARSPSAIPIRGINSDLPVKFAPNGGAVPGDRIVGIVSPGEGITIYPIQSPALKDFEEQPERWLDVRWDVDERTLLIRMRDDPRDLPESSAMPNPPPLRLGVNVDHVATLRNARAGLRPDPVRAALAAIEAGADGITAHLREDRRHIRDEDMARLKAEISKPLNFEMAATADMLAIALATKPHAVCLVPERRGEIPTHGGPP